MRYMATSIIWDMGRGVRLYSETVRVVRRSQVGDGISIIIQAIRPGRLRAEEMEVLPVGYQGVASWMIATCIL